MTLKQKAEELVNAMGFSTSYTINDGEEMPLHRNQYAKQCALKAVDEIMSEAKWWHDTSSYEESTDFEGGEKRLNYWQEVKTEIENL
jgi:hypothetical protein